MLDLERVGQSVPLPPTPSRRELPPTRQPKLKRRGRDGNESRRHRSNDTNGPPHQIDDYA